MASGSAWQGLAEVSKNIQHFVDRKIFRQGPWSISKSDLQKYINKGYTLQEIYDKGGLFPAQKGQEHNTHLVNLVLPGHVFTGPGNDANDPREPVDSDDRISKDHDHIYSEAKDSNTIHAADFNTVIDFVGDWQNSGNWHSAAAAFLLGTKYSVEHLKGDTIYPRIGK